MNVTLVLLVVAGIVAILIFTLALSASRRGGRTKTGSGADDGTTGLLPLWFVGTASSDDNGGGSDGGSGDSDSGGGGDGGGGGGD